MKDPKCCDYLQPLLQMWKAPNYYTYNARKTGHCKRLIYDAVHDVSSVNEEDFSRTAIRIHNLVKDLSTWYSDRF